MTKETMAQINASMPPDLCAPAAAFLAHESCSLNGEVLRAGMGTVARVAVVFSQGMSRAAISVEDIAENIDTIINLGDAGLTDAAAPSNVMGPHPEITCNLIFVLAERKKMRVTQEAR